MTDRIICNEEFIEGLREHATLLSETRPNASAEFAALAQQLEISENPHYNVSGDTFTKYFEIMQEVARGEVRE